MHVDTPVPPLTAASALLALAAVNALLWVGTVQVVGDAVGWLPSSSVLAVLGVATGLAVLVPTTLRIALDRVRAPSS